MGKGKGAPEAWVVVVKPGRMLFEMEGVSVAVAAEAMRLAAHEISVPTKFVSRHQSTEAEGELRKNMKADKIRDLDPAESDAAGAGCAGAAVPASFPDGHGPNRRPEEVPDAAQRSGAPADRAERKRRR